MLVFYLLQDVNIMSQ
jgi:hypothetical protein